MRKLSFIPGPSKINDAVYTDIDQAVKEGVMEMSHRSDAFLNTANNCLANLRSFLKVPKDYQILLLDSASASWHSLVANLVEKHSTHLVNGAFSKKASVASKALYKETTIFEVELGKQIDVSKIDIPNATELLTVCYNESSTGVCHEESDIKYLREKNPDTLLAIDITSIAGALEIDLLNGDAWYFSIQKAFGLPAGLGVLILSPRAIERSLNMTKQRKNLAGMWSWQTYLQNQADGRGPTYQTPNMLAIYLLDKQTERYLKNGGLSKISNDTKEKANRIWSYFKNHAKLNPFPQEEVYLSPTIITITGDSSHISKLHAEVKNADMLIGAGYGSLATSTFRIANFPSHSQKDIESLLSVIDKIEM